MANLYNNCPNQGSCDDASDATNCNMSGTCTGNSTDGTKNCDDYAEKDNVNVTTPTINGSGSALASAGDDTEYLYVSDEQVAMTSTSTSLQLFPNADGYQYELAGGNSEICEVTSDGNILFKESGYIMVDVYNDEGELVGRYGVSLYYNDSGTNTLVVGKVCCYDEKTDTPATVEPTAIQILAGDETATRYISNEEFAIVTAVIPTKSDQRVVFSSSNTDVATVTEDGIVTLVGLGNVTITVESAIKDSVTATVNFAVVDSPDYGTVTIMEEDVYVIKQQQSLLRSIISSTGEKSVAYTGNAEVDEDSKWYMRNEDGYIYIYKVEQTELESHEYYLCYDGRQLSIAELDEASKELNGWMLRCFNGEYSICHANTEIYLCVDNDSLAMLPMEAAVGFDFRWQIISTKELNMPTNLNQKYALNCGKEKIYTQFFHGGCMACSYADIVGYYHHTTYTIQDVINNGWWAWYEKPDYTDEDGEHGYYCAYRPGLSKYHIVFEQKTCSDKDEYIPIIKKELLAKRPVMIHLHSDTGHYVVAYKFEPGEDTLDDIWVLDPYNPDNASSKGRCHSVQKACTESGCDYIDFITTTKMIST